MREKSYDRAEALLLQALDLNDHESAVRIALSGLVITYTHTKNPAVMNAVGRIVSTPQFAPQALQVLVSMNLRDKNIAEATSVLSRLASEHPLSTDLFHAQLDLVYALRRGGDRNLIATTLAAATPRNEDQVRALASAFRAVQLRPGQAPNVRVTGDETQTLRIWSYPNPFNPSASITVDIPERQHASLTVYDVLGRVVTVLLRGVVEPGIHTFRFDAETLATGIYLYRLEAGPYVATGTMNLIR